MLHASRGALHKHKARRPPRNTRRPFGWVASLVMIGAAVMLPVGPAASASVKAFPGAEGFGTDTVGGRGGEVCQVTNLKDSGAGSLRACVEKSGPRTVIFRTGGTIELVERLEVSDPFLTIAGQTAPGDGITLRMKPGTGYDKGVMKIDTHDVVVRYIRFRPGDAGGADDSHDAMSAYKSGGGAYNLVFDHCSFSYAVDENVNIYYDARDYTISNSIISEALSNAGHPKGEHSKGMLIGGGSTNASIHHNLFASNVDRNPQVSGVSGADLRNNVVYNYGDGSGGGVTLLSSSKGKPSANWVGNYYKPGPNSPKDRAEFATYNGSTGKTHTFYAADNMRWTSSGDKAARIASGAVGQQNSPIPAAPVTTSSAAQAYTDVLAGAGASRVRDAIDARIIDEVRNGGGSFKDSGSWPTLQQGTAPTDGDGDGMPDSFEQSHGTNPAKADANGDVNGNGYTNIEDWFNGLTGSSSAGGSTASDAGTGSAGGSTGGTDSGGSTGGSGGSTGGSTGGSGGSTGGTDSGVSTGPGVSTGSGGGTGSEPAPTRLECPTVENPKIGQEVTCTYR